MRLTHLERRLLRYEGVSDVDVARAEGLRLRQVIIGRAQLRHRRAAAGAAIAAAEIDEVRRTNRPVRGL